MTVGSPPSLTAADREPGEPEPAEHMAALVPYWRAVTAHPWVVLLVSLLAPAAAIAVLFLRAPVYEAQVEVLVTPIPTTDRSFVGLSLVRGIGDPGRSVETAASLLDAPRIAAQAARELPGVTAEQIDREVEVAAGEESDLLLIEARSEEAEGAARLANVYARAALETRRRQLRRQVRARTTQVERELGSLPQQRGEAAEGLRRVLADLATIQDGSDPTMTVVAPAQVPDAPDRPPRWVVLALSLAAGIALGAAAALLAEILTRRKSVRESDLAEILPLPLLARIPEARGKDPLEAAEVREAYRRGRAVLEGAGAGGDPERPLGLSGTIAVISPSSGDGRTSAVLGLCRVGGLVRRGLIAADLDLRRPALGDRLGADPEPALVEAIGGRVPLADLLRPTAVLDLRVLPAAGRLSPAEFERLLTATPRVLGELNRMADCVVVDTPPLGEVADAMSVLEHADNVVVVVRPGHTRVADLRALREALDALRITADGLLVIEAG